MPGSRPYAPAMVASMACATDQSSGTRFRVSAARRGDHGAALRLSVEAEARAATTELLWDQAEVALDRADVLLLAGRPAEARTAAEDALARFERKEYAIGIRRARDFLAALPGWSAGAT